MYQMSQEKITAPQAKHRSTTPCGISELNQAIQVCTEFRSPEMIACDKEAAIKQIDRNGKAKENLERKHRIAFRFVIPNGHFSTGLVVRKMKDIHEWVGKLRLTGTGMSTAEMSIIFQYVAHKLNSVPN